MSAKMWQEREILKRVHYQTRSAVEQGGQPDAYSFLFTITQTAQGLALLLLDLVLRFSCLYLP